MSKNTLNHEIALDGAINHWENEMHLGLDSGNKEYTARCRKLVEKYVRQWEEYTGRCAFYSF